MEFDDLANLVKNRRSIRSWQDKEVSEELLIQAVELATWAPNGANQQNWHFYIILNRDTIKAVADAVQASADRIISWPEANQVEGLTTRLRERASFFRSAPAAIAVAAAWYQAPIDKVLAAREKADPIAGQIRQWRNEVSSAIQSASAAIAYLLLILHQMGLGAIWMTGPMQSKGEIKTILKIPDEINLIALIPVGYTDKIPEPKERKPVAEVCEIVK